MPDANEPIDIQRLIAEVAARHGLLFKRDEPAIAMVTMNQLILDFSLATVHKQICATITEFHASMQEAEIHAGNMLAQGVKESAAQLREGLQGDIHIAGLKAREYVHIVNEAHRRSSLIRWGSAGLAAGALILAVGIYVGKFLLRF